jgi:hypothetical protein
VVLSFSIGGETAVVSVTAFSRIDVVTGIAALAEAGLQHLLAVYLIY